MNGNQTWHHTCVMAATALAPLAVITENEGNSRNSTWMKILKIQKWNSFQCRNNFLDSEISTDQPGCLAIFFWQKRSLGSPWHAPAARSRHKASKDHPSIACETVGMLSVMSSSKLNLYAAVSKRSCRFFCRFLIFLCWSKIWFINIVWPCNAFFWSHLLRLGTHPHETMLLSKARNQPFFEPSNIMAMRCGVSRWSYRCLTELRVQREHYLFISLENLT